MFKRQDRQGDNWSGVAHCIGRATWDQSGPRTLLNVPGASASALSNVRIRAKHLRNSGCEQRRQLAAAAKASFVKKCKRYACEPKGCRQRLEDTERPARNSFTHGASLELGRCFQSARSILPTVGTRKSPRREMPQLNLWTDKRPLPYNEINLW
jgi:hypothetical protein